MPLVLLLTGTVSVTSQSHSSAADLLVDGLLELLVVEDGPDLPVTVLGPVRSGDLYSRLADVLLGGVRVFVRLSPREVPHLSLVSRQSLISAVVLSLQHLLKSPLQNVSSYSEYKVLI